MVIDPITSLADEKTWCLYEFVVKIFLIFLNHQDTKTRRDRDDLTFLVEITVDPVD